jgi:hypothetical protein
MSLSEGENRGPDMVIHWAETASKAVTVPVIRDVFLVDRSEEPLANLDWNFYYKDNLFGFFLGGAVISFSL